MVRFPSSPGVYSISLKPNVECLHGAYSLNRNASLSVNQHDVYARGLIELAKVNKSDLIFDFRIRSELNDGIIHDDSSSYKKRP